MRRAFVTGFVALAIGCGARPSEPAKPASPPAASAPASQETSEAPSDDDAEAVIQRALAHVAELRELPPKTPVKGVVISREALLARIKNDLLVDLEEELIFGSKELLFALNLTPADFDYFANLLLLYGTQLAGFYDPKAKEMVLLDDLGVEAQDATLWHELVHALQDQHYDLQKLVKWSPERGDAVTAVQSLAEGDATSAMMDVMLLPRGQRALDIPESLFAKQISAIEALPEVAAVPSILKRSIVAPYTDGMVFAHALRREGDWAAVDAAWRSPPETTEQLLHPEKYRAREPAEAVPLPPAPPGGPGVARYRDVLGEQAIRLVFEEWVPLETARKAAAGWGGDRAVVFAEGDQVAVAIHLRYDDEASALRGFEATVRGALSDPVENRTHIRSATADGAAKATRTGRHCSERELRGPFAVVRSGRDLGVTLGPYTRDKAATRSAATCAKSLGWAEAVAKSR